MNQLIWKGWNKKNIQKNGVSWVVWNSERWRWTGWISVPTDMESWELRIVTVNIPYCHTCSPHSFCQIGDCKLHYRSGQKKKRFPVSLCLQHKYSCTQWQVGGGTSINNSDSAQRERGWRKTGRVLVRVRISKEAKASTNELIRLVLSENVENHRIHFWLSYCCVLYYSIKKIKVLNAALTCCCWPHNNRKVEWVYYRYVTHRGELHFENFTAYLTNSQTNHKLNEKSAWIWISDCCGCVDSGHILDNFSN